MKLRTHQSPGRACLSFLVAPTSRRSYIITLSDDDPSSMIVCLYVKLRWSRGSFYWLINFGSQSECISRGKWHHHHLEPNRRGCIFHPRPGLDDIEVAHRALSHGGKMQQSIEMESGVSFFPMGASQGHDHSVTVQWTWLPQVAVVGLFGYYAIFVPPSAMNRPTQCPMMVQALAIALVEMHRGRK